MDGAACPRAALPVAELLALPVAELLALPVTELLALPVTELLALPVTELLALPVTELLGVAEKRAEAKSISQHTRVFACSQGTSFSFAPSLPLIHVTTQSGKGPLGSPAFQ